MEGLKEKNRILIQLLSDGNFHSGEDIGRQLGVSRTAVWKQVKKLAELGMDLESVKGKGYCLASGIELLHRDTLLAAMDAEATPHISRLDLLFDTESTNEWAMKKLAQGEVGSGYVCLAEFQRKGRGRRGRRWVSPFGSNLTMSLVWQFEGAAALEGLSLVVGIAVVRALNSLGLEGARLKWPNDILLANKKLGGILLEMTGDPAGSCQIVIGIGINVLMSDNQEGIEQPWTALAEHLPGASRNLLGAAIINKLLPVLSSYPVKGFSSYREEWLRCDAYLGKQVKVSSGERHTRGLVTGVADNGALLLEVDAVEMAFHGGEISLRLDSDS